MLALQTGTTNVVQVRPLTINVVESGSKFRDSNFLQGCLISCLCCECRQGLPAVFGPGRRYIGVIKKLKQRGLVGGLVGELV